MITATLPKSEVFALAKRVQIVARIYGFWPFSINPIAETDDNLSILHTKACDYIWFAVVLVIYTILATIEFVSFRSLATEKYSSNEVILQLMTMISEIVITFAGLIMDMINRQLIWDIILMLNAFDVKVIFLKKIYRNVPEVACSSFFTQMSEWGFQLNFKVHRRRVICSILGVVVTMSLLIACSGSFSPLDVDEGRYDVLYKVGIGVSFIYLGTSHMAVSTIYIFLLFSVKVRYALLNDALR